MVDTENKGKMIIKGYVFDDYDVLPGVNIWEGNNVIGRTEIDGSYSIDVPSNSIIRFTYTAMKEKSLSASELAAKPNVIMEWDTQLETVVIDREVKVKKSATGIVLSGLAAFLLLIGISSKPE